jgi:hypothetical protein
MTIHAKIVWHWRIKTELMAEINILGHLGFIRLAPGVQSTLLTQRLPGLAGISSVQNEPMMGDGKQILRYVLYQDFLGFLR